jgi:2-hydroxychromene-2-carboxylate isomerase
MRAATYAHGLGLTREFALAATRSAFTRGTDLGLIEPVLDAAAEVGIARDDLRAAIAEPEVKDALREATENAHERGVFGVPTTAIGDDLFWGDDRLEDAAALAASG